MLIMGIHQVPSLTQERYEEVVRRLTNGKCRLESISDLPFEGLLFHLAGQGKDGFCIVDVFESEEAVQRFNAAMGSIPKEVGIEATRFLPRTHFYLGLTRSSVPHRLPHISVCGVGNVWGADRAIDFRANQDICRD